ncbi:hypothetical protein DICVIV_00872 [Dictyocaulus viviparus]|uniref:Spectrin repeat-containing domain protein n=1 Tax=Dictyocaulus viviparus TaxID=29172 RepID=A0A0D8Y820_DICVI|nr:hypothetical protein DICVIV_00872 [Dictyocaulus viviparus]
MADDKLALLAKAIPLSERFHEGFDAVMEWIEAIEEDLVQIDSADLDTQVQLVFSMEEGVNRWRPEIDDLVAVSSQLQRLCSPDQAEELFQSTVEMSRRVNHIADGVARRAERIDIADKQSRVMFDELTYLVEWLTDARDRIISASPPSIDPDFACSQLRSQLVMNDDVTSNKNRLRELSVEVRKFCRGLIGETSDSASFLAEQCDHAKNLVDEVCALCRDRTEILERALALSQHLTVEFDRLANWLDQIEDKYKSAPDFTDASLSYQIQEQRTNNLELSSAISTYLPVVEQFRSDVEDLKKICVYEDGLKLGELADEIITRYDEIRNAVEVRGQVLDSIVDASSGLGERIDNFMHILKELYDRVHQDITFSSDISMLKNQIANINELKQGLRRKNDTYTSLLESASEVLSSIPEDDPSHKSINENLQKLSKLWCSLEHEIENRKDMLDSALIKADRFWNEIDESQREIDDLRVRLESIELAAGQHELLQQQQLEVESIACDMSTIENKLAALREAGTALSDIIQSEEQIVINDQVDTIHEGWESVKKLMGSKKRDLIMAIDDATALHIDVSNLLDWLKKAEARLATFSDPESLKEQVLYAATHITNGAPFHQLAAIHHPISELNLRWAQLYAALCDRENKV